MEAFLPPLSRVPPFPAVHAALLALLTLVPLGVHPRQDGVALRWALRCVCLCVFGMSGGAGGVRLLRVPSAPSHPPREVGALQTTMGSPSSELPLPLPPCALSPPCTCCYLSHSERAALPSRMILIAKDGCCSGSKCEKKKKKTLNPKLTLYPVLKHAKGSAGLLCPWLCRRGPQATPC